MTEEKAFLPKEAVKELARLRADLARAETVTRVNEGVVMRTPEWEGYSAAKDYQAELSRTLNSAEAAFKAGCENIFEETDEKKFPGGQIKMRSTIDYIEITAINWAIKHEHVELLSLKKAPFKKMCSGINPIYGGTAFVKKEKAGKMYIDSDLSQYLEDSAV